MTNISEVLEKMEVRINQIEEQSKNPNKCMKCGSVKFKKVIKHSYKIIIYHKCLNCENTWVIKV